MKSDEEQEEHPEVFTEIRERAVRMVQEHRGEYLPCTVVG